MKLPVRILTVLCLLPLAACTAPSPQPEVAQPLPIPTVTAVISPEQTESPANHGNVTVIQDLLTARAAHTATRLADGRVLIAGGFNQVEPSIASAEIFDPISNMFAPTGSMTIARQSHTATLLQNGKVLIAGGYGPQGEYLGSTETYDPQTGEFTPAGQLAVPRAGQIAVLLQDGKVLLAGGVGTDWVFLDSAEIYDPDSDIFTPTGSMALTRESHTATLLQDGRVLITGGHKGRRASLVIHASAELYDPATSLFTATADMLIKRHKHDAVLLGDGSVLVIGGADERDQDGQYFSAEKYDPRTGEFVEVGNMSATRYKFQGTSILLQTGQVLLMGGASVTEIYDPQTRIFSQLQVGVGTTRLFATATSLPDGRVLLSGGYGTNTSASANAWIYKP